MVIRTSALCHLFATSSAIVLIAPAAQAQVQAYDLNIPARDLDGALKALSSATGQQVAFRGAVVRGKRSPALKGRYTIDQAFDALLAGSGLAIKRIGGGVFVIEPAPVDNVGNGDAGSGEDIVVTGSHIRGGESASPMITIGKKQFKEEGFTDLGEVIRSIPQNFRGGQNPGTASGASFGGNANQDRTGGSSLNLRGLGPDATLTLLNGRRLSYDNAYQAIDISAIPIAAVERIDIVPDGASAIYGSDAVAGVANVVLRRDFRGLTVSALRGGATEGGLARREYNATAGTVWKGGGVLATFIASDQDPLYADQRAYTTTMFQPFTIYPPSTLRSGLISAHQSLGEQFVLNVDMFRTIRKRNIYYARATTYYNDPSSTDTNIISPNLRVLTGDWAITIGGSYSSNGNRSQQYQHIAGATPLTGNSKYRNETISWEMGADGTITEIGGVPLKSAIGFGGRVDRFQSENLLSNTTFGGDQKNKFAYMELSAPVFGSLRNYEGIQRLDLSAAFRVEDYDSFGRVMTPKLGIVYDPTHDLSLKASWGKSFKAPSLYQRYYYQYSYLLNARDYGCTGCTSGSTVLMASGGNPALKPERATTWTASLVLHPKALSRFNAELTYFHIDYDQRIVEPVSNYARALSDPAFSRFVMLNPTVTQQQQLISDYSYSFFNQSGAPYDPAKVVAIVQAQYANVTRQRVHGVDLSGSYRFDIGAGRLELRGSGAWLDLRRQISADVSEIELSGSVYYPAKFNGRLGAVWTDGGFNLSIFGNHTSGSTNAITATTQRLGSFTTLDAAIRYETSKGNGVLSGLSFALTVNNLLNRAPPLFTPPSTRYVPYDSTNASAIGRYVMLTVSKQFF